MTNSITITAINNDTSTEEFSDYYEMDAYLNKVTEKLIESTSETYSTINLAIINNLPKSVTKAIYIDAPINLYYSATSSQAFHKTGISAATYEIRAQSKDYLIKLGLDQNTAGALAGFVGGSFKYYMTDQNPVIGALNNAAYELCNNNDFCSNNIYANIAFTIAVESLDAAAQTTLNLASGNTIGTAFKITEAVEKISENINKATSKIKVADVAKTTGGKILSTADKITKSIALQSVEKGAIEASKQITEAAVKSVVKIAPTIIEEVAKETLSSAFNSIKKAAVEGAMVGAFVSFDVYTLLVPALIAAEDLPANTCSLYGIFAEDVFASISI